MARFHDSPLRQNLEFETVFRDLHGSIVVRNQGGTYVVTWADGSSTEHRLTEYLQTVDGVSWSPHMLQGPNPVWLIRCARCRRASLFARPSHGLCTMAAAERCVSCNEVCCPPHQRRCADRSIRCINCARWFRIRRFFRPLFFERLSEE